jgi:signal transduction histidine kinase/NO-binding membrane sensor protein with MHYT domain/DNA-binding response OmpR family regulator
MDWYQSFFQIGPAPADAMQGVYNMHLVWLSYIIASITSYVALDMSAHLKRENTKLFEITWWLGGSIIMGAGIWSMHFVGMLAFEMDMPMSYDIRWTLLSMVVASIAAAIAFLFFMIKKPKWYHYMLSGAILGIAIPAMHYTGMAGMNGVSIRYYPSLFILSVLVAVVAAIAALWLSAYSDQGKYSRRIRLKIVSALIMGVAICGMHYTGMAAAVMTHTMSMSTGVAEFSTEPTILAILIATIVISILIVALILSTTKYYVSNKVQNDKDFLEIVLNGLRGGVIAFDANKRLKLLNQVSRDLFGNLDNQKINPDEWDKAISLLNPNNRQPMLNKDYPLARIAAGEKIKGLEAIVVNNKGKERVLSIDGQLLFDQENEKLGVVMVYQDITERKEVDQMKNEFISTVSHELRTPLTSIRGSLGLIMGGAMGTVPKEMAPLLEIACNNSERLVRLINDILDTEKIESGKMVFHFAKADLGKLIEQAVIANKAYADKYQVTYTIKELIPGLQVNIDADRIRQVIDNLLSNAAKFSKSGGVVEVAMQQTADKIIVSIKDNGIGIPQEFQARMFSKFYQADSSDVREKGGTGLGLSICKSIIEAHNGKIWFDSKDGVGTIFYFELLESKAEIPETDDIEHGVECKRILICEDEPDVSKLLGLILRERGYSSVKVYTIEEAKKALLTQQFCLMTLDLLLPDGNGLELLKWMRSQSGLENLPVVIISAISIEQEKVKGSALGVVDWINKPIDENRLYKDVAQVLGTKNGPEKSKVLHIEDDLDIAKVVAALLNDICDTEVSNSVAAAKRMLNAIKYDLIILDLNLKDGNGYEVLAFLDENGYKIPVVILSVDEPEGDISKNIVASLVKSKISNQDLLEKIISVIEGNKKENK